MRPRRPWTGLDCRGTMCEKHGFGFGVPQTIVGPAGFVEAGKEGAALPQLFKVGKRGQRHLEVGIGEYLSGPQRGQAGNRIGNRVKPADMRYHNRRPQLLFRGEAERFLKIIGVAARASQNMRTGVVAVVQVHQR